MSSVACGSVGTGTATTPEPRLPSTATRTCQAPAVIIQSCPVNNRGSSAGPCREIGRRRELSAGAGQRQRHDPHVTDVGPGGEDFDLGDAWNHARRPDGDQHAVRSGLGVEKHVGAADVSRCRPRQHDERRAEAAISGAERDHWARGR